MKQKFKFKRKKTNKAKKVLLGIGVGFLALAAAAGTAWALNNHYDWVELPEWLTPQTSEPVTSEEPVEVNHVVLIMSTDQNIGSFGGVAGYIGGDSSIADLISEELEFVITEELISIKFDATELRFEGGVLFYESDLVATALVYDDFENGFIYDFSELTVVEGEALVPVITAIA